MKAPTEKQVKAEAKGVWFGARSGRWQRMGVILQRLNNRGLVWRN